MKIQIKHRISLDVLFECEADSMKIAVKLAIENKANLSYADLSFADLSYADLRYANLRYANLRYANLSSANLRYANLSYADLRFADLSYADLSSADLSYADLSSADLRSADLHYADLRSANLRSANLSYADLMLFRFNRDEAFFQFDGKIRIGCKYETVEWWLANYSEVGARESYSATEILAYGNFIRLCDELQKGKVK